MAETRKGLLQCFLARVLRGDSSSSRSALARGHVGSVHGSSNRVSSCLEVASFISEIAGCLAHFFGRRGRATLWDPPSGLDGSLPISLPPRPGSGTCVRQAHSRSEDSRHRIGPAHKAQTNSSISPSSLRVHDAHNTPRELAGAADPTVKGISTPRVGHAFRAEGLATKIKTYF